MKAVIVTIGDELLIGQVVDTNSVFIGQQLEAIGCSIVEKVAISDKDYSIFETMRRYQNQVDLVVLTGGLGPTKDDVTKKTFARYFNDSLQLNHQVFEHVKKRMEKFYQRPISDANVQQAYLPSKSVVLFNDVGTASGMLMKKEKTTYVSLPGVPFEMKYLVSKRLLPFIHENFDLNAIVHTTVLTVGIGESLLSETIATWEDSLTSVGIDLFYLPQPGLVRLRLSAVGSNKNKLVEQIQVKIDELKRLIPENYIGISTADSLMEEVTMLLKIKKLSIATAESCTGGAIAKELTTVEGASTYFKGSAVTYATESKIKLLGVLSKTIESYSVVSEQVAREMAIGARELFQTDLAVATTGNAGPLKGDSGKEVGTVCIAIATNHEVLAFTFDFGQPRSKVIEATVNKVWFLLYKLLSS